MTAVMSFLFFFSSRRRHTRCSRDWSSDVCSSDLENIFFVLNEQDIFVHFSVVPRTPFSAAAWDPGILCCLGSGIPHNRQMQSENTARAEFAFHGKMTPHGLGDVFGKRQPQSGPMNLLPDNEIGRAHV